MGPRREKIMSRTVWIVKADMGYRKGWQEVKRFDNPADADKWLTRLIRANGYNPTDFTIIAKTIKGAARKG